MCHRQSPHGRGQIGTGRGRRLLQETVKQFLPHSGETEVETAEMDLGEVVGSRREGAGTQEAAQPRSPGSLPLPVSAPLSSTVGILERRGHREVLGRKKVGYRGVALVRQG